MVHMQYLFMYNVSDVCNLIGAGCQERLELVSSNMDLLTSNVESKPWGFCMIAFIARNDCCTLWNIHWNSMECLHGVTEWDAIFLKWHSATLIFQFFDATWPCFSWFDMNNEAASQAINAAERRRSRAAMCRCQGRSWGSCPWHVELQANFIWTHDTEKCCWCSGHCGIPACVLRVVAHMFPDLHWIWITVYSKKL